MGKLIEADALKANVLKWLPPDPCGREEWEYPVETDLVVSLLQEIEQAPTVDAVEVVTGTWKAVTDDGENYKRICTCCGKEAPFDELEGVYLIYPHCPWCGADMWKDGGNE